MTEQKTTRHTETRCPVCNHKLDASSSFEGHTPKEGDFSVCIECASILRFKDPELRLGLATQDDIDPLLPEEREDLNKAVAAVIVLRRKEIMG